MTQVPAERATRNRINTRSRLLEAASAVFAEVGVDAASVEAIAERAGFTRGAFYSNFESKEHLYFEVVAWVTDGKLARIGARVREIEAEGARAMPLQSVLNRILDVIVNTPGEIRFMNEFAIRAMRDQRTAEAYLRWQEGMGSRVRAIVADVVAATGITVSMPAEELAQIVMFVLEGTSTQAVIAGLEDDVLAAQIRSRTLAIVLPLVTAHAMAPGSAAEAD